MVLQVMANARCVLLYDYAFGLQMLGWAYAVLPCVLKLMAAAALYFLIVRPAQAPGTRPL